MRTFALLLFIKLVVSFNFEPCCVFASSLLCPGDYGCENQQLQRTNQLLRQAIRSLNSGRALQGCRSDSDCPSSMQCYRAGTADSECINKRMVGSKAAFGFGQYGHYMQDWSSQDDGEVKCANEGGQCSCNGLVRYGAAGGFSEWRTVSGSIACNNGVFGDPLPYTFKACYCRGACPPNDPNDVFRPFLEYSTWHGHGVDPELADYSKSKTGFDPTGLDFMWNNADYVSWWNTAHNPFIKSTIPSITSIPRTTWISIKDMIGCPDKIKGLLMEGADRFRTQNGTAPDFQCFHFPKNVYGCVGSCASVNYVHLHSMGEVWGHHYVDHNLPSGTCRSKSDQQYQDYGACAMCQRTSCYGVCVDGSRDAYLNAKSIVTVLGTLPIQ